MNSVKISYTIILVTVIVIVINVLSGHYNIRLDLTEGKEYTLGKATRNILKNLDKPARKQLQGAIVRSLGERNDQPADGAPGESDHRQGHGPPGGVEDEEKFGEAESAHQRPAG